MTRSTMSKTSPMRPDTTSTSRRRSRSLATYMSRVAMVTMIQMSAISPLKLSSVGQSTGMAMWAPVGHLKIVTNRTALRKGKRPSCRTNLSSSRMKPQTTEARYRHLSSRKKRTGKTIVKLRKRKLPGYHGARLAPDSTKEAHLKVSSLPRSRRSNKKKSLRKQWLSRKASRYLQPLVTRR